MGSWGDAGNFSISWYNKDLTEYSISDSKEFAGLAFLVNNGYADFKGKTVKLASDIDISEKKWVTIGLSSAYPFRGIFDGQNHTIRVYFIDQKDDQRYYGIWGYTENATIKNLKVKGDISIVDPVANIEYGVGYTKYPTLYIGGIVGSLDGTLLNCKCDGNVAYILSGLNAGKKGVINLGGLCGYAKGIISYCSHSGYVSHSETNSTANAYLGGLIGLSDANIEYCENISEFIYVDNTSSFSMKVGGIAGAVGQQDRLQAKISYCRSLVSKFTVHAVGSYSNYNNIGGVIGSLYNEYNNAKVNIVNCYSSVEAININVGINSWKFGGMGCISEDSNNKANYSNSDIKFENDISAADNIASIDGSTAFTSSQMQTPAFLEKLNMYSMLEMDDGPVWTQDAGGGYPYIAKLYDTEEGYYYVGNLNSWDITDRTYPFEKSDDGETWMLTMNATTSDEFLIVPAGTTDWGGLTYGTADSNLRSGTVVENEGRNNFRVPYLAGMDAYKIEFNPIQKTYSIARHRSTTTTTCDGLQNATDGRSYRVAGIVGNITNTVDGNWYLKDETGEVYIYGTRDKDGYTGKNNSIDVWNIETGDTIIVVGVKQVYNGMVELVDVGVEAITKKNPFVIQDGIMLVTPQDSLQLAVAYAPDNTTIKLSAGDYYIKYPTLDYYGGLSIKKNVTIEGEGIGVTTIHGRFDMQNGAGLTLKNLTLGGENTNQSQPIIYRDDTAYNELDMINCEVKSYEKGLLYVNVKASIPSVTIDGCLLHDIPSLQDFIDCRKGYVGRLKIANSSIYRCAQSRDFIRMDDSSESFDAKPGPQTIVQNNTFYEVGYGKANYRLFYIRYPGNVIIFQNNVVAYFNNTRGFANMSKTTDSPILGQNYYYHTENLLIASPDADSTIKWFDTEGEEVDESINLFRDVENDDFTLLIQLGTGKSGDPRWYFDTSGINGVSVAQKENVAIYSLSGQRLTAPRRGVNIVGGRKVVVR